MEGRAARHPLWQRSQLLLRQPPQRRQQGRGDLVQQVLLAMPHAVAAVAVHQRQAAPGRCVVQLLFRAAAQRCKQRCCCCYWCCGRCC